MSDLRFAAPVERRVALVTGGARGIGQASALRIAREGRDIALLDLLDDEGAQTVDAIEALGQRAIYQRVDVRDEAAVHEAVATHRRAAGPPRYTRLLRRCPRCRSALP